MDKENSGTANGSDFDSGSKPNANASGNEASKTLVDPAEILATIKSEGGTDEYARDENGNIKYNKDGSPRKKRGRKAGTTATRKSTSGDTALISSINTLAQSLQVVHMGIASFTKFDGFALSDTESVNLSKSVVNVMEQFDVTVDPRFSAIAGLVTTAGMIYGPRFYLYSEFRKEEKKKKQQEVAETSTMNFDPFVTGNVNSGVTSFPFVVADR